MVHGIGRERIEKITALCTKLCTLSIKSCCSNCFNAMFLFVHFTYCGSRSPISIIYLLNENTLEACLSTHNFRNVNLKTRKCEENGIV